MTKNRSHLLKVYDTLVARSEHSLLYRTYNNRYFIVCECGKMLGVCATRDMAEQSWHTHWITRPYCSASRSAAQKCKTEDKIQS